MKTAILKFVGEDEWASNFYPSPMTMPVNNRMITYPTVEHLYQALKAETEQDHDYVLSLPTPDLAKKAGKKIKLRPDWEHVKDAIMMQCLKLKFGQNSDLAKKLIASYPLYLEEGNTWGDEYWGVCNGVGNNILGILLMAVRRKLISTDGSINGPY